MNISCIAVDCVGESFQCRLTTDHSASSYNLPVIVRGNQVFEYSDVATLWLVKDMDTDRHVRFELQTQLDEVLGPYGVEVRRWVG